MRFILLHAMAMFIASLSLHAQTASDYSADVLHAHFNQQLEMIKVTPGFTPPVASRALGYSGLAAYESVVHGLPGRVSLAGILPQLDELPLPSGGAYHWGEVANHALYAMALAFYSNAPQDLLDGALEIRNDLSALHSDEVDTVVLAASAAYGIELGDALAAYAGLDGQAGCQFSNFPVDFEVPVGPGLWTPLPGQQALQPYWGDKRCFVVEFVSSEMISAAPPVFSDQPGSELYTEAMAVYDAVNNVTPEEVTIAEYWADGPGTVTPPGHSIAMLTQVLELENSDLGFAAEGYARVGFGVADAFVQCWKTKYIYNLERPITFINSYIDPDWSTIVATPPFPEYTSGHSSQSGAWGAIMTAMFGENYVFTDHTHGSNFGGPRTFNSFAECAEETAVSRLYGGIHFPIGNTMGSMSGIMIGELVNQLFDQAVGTVEYAARSTFSVYPNPSNGVVNLPTMFDADHRVNVHSATGRLVEVMPAQRQLSLGTLPAGMYVLSVVDRSGHQVASSRVILY